MLSGRYYQRLRICFCNVRLISIFYSKIVHSSKVKMQNIIKMLNAEMKYRLTIY